MERLSVRGSARGSTQGEDPVRLGIGERNEQHRIRDAEDGRSRAHAKSAQEHGRHGEQRCAPHLTPREAQVLERLVDPGFEPDRPGVLSRLRLVPERPLGAPLRFCRRHTAFDERLLEECAMVVEFLGQIGGVAPIPHAGDNTTEPAGHDQASASTRPIAVVIRSYEACSAAKRFRPARVRR